MYGPNGAAYMFAPQKGADQQMVIHLDNQLRAFAQTIQTQLLPVGIKVVLPS